MHQIVATILRRYHFVLPSSAHFQGELTIFRY